MKSKDIQKTLGLTIRHLRGEAGWSQDEFAYHCGLHRTYAGSVERGERNISLENIVRICDALGIKISDLFKKCGL